MSKAITLFEFDAVYAGGSSPEIEKNRLFGVPQSVYDWLEIQCIGMNDDASRWLKLTRKNSIKAIQFTGYVGVLRSPDGFQIEVLPKTGKVSDASGTRELESKTRALLIKMLKCLPDFRHYKTSDAEIQVAKMPLLEVFIWQFLQSVEAVVMRGLRSDYVARQDNLFALRGKLMMSQHLKQNIVRRDRFFTEHDDFLSDRAENRLLHTALRRVLKISRSADNQKLARELGFVFNEIPDSTDVARDMQRIRLDRGMSYYEAALDWAKLILNGYSPLTGLGKSHAISLMFPMAELFEAYVARHLTKQLNPACVLKTQARTRYLVRHKVNDHEMNWFQLKPDLLIHAGGNIQLILDTKWKLIDGQKSNGKDKYDLSQADFYQLHAYGHNYLKGEGDVVLIYPLTDNFTKPLPVFNFSNSVEFDSRANLRLWVLPFCLDKQKLFIPEDLDIRRLLSN
jgi:5-methylcytosine-specific restriction enzyme subunit McrC